MLNASIHPCKLAWMLVTEKSKIGAICSNSTNNNNNNKNNISTSNKRINRQQAELTEPLKS
jgi:hypothetical protein